MTFYNGQPSLNQPIVTQNFTINAVQDLIQAGANKIVSSSLSNPNPTLGQTFDVILNGETGTIGTNNQNAMYYTPAGFADFPASSFQLVSTKVAFSGGMTGTYIDTLLIPQADVAANTGAATYVATYTFKAVGTTSSDTQTSPIAYIASGSNNVKHNDVTNVPIIPVVTGNAPQIDTTSIPNWTINQPYNQTLQSSGGTGPYSYSVTSGSLPAGLVLNPDGTITGTPTGTGTFTFNATVTDANGIASTKPFNFTINSLPSITGPVAFPNGTLNQAYPSTPVIVSGGTPGYSNFTVASGSLPTGLMLDPNTGIVSGTPTVAGTYNFTISATDSAGAVASKAFNNFVVNATQAPVITGPASLPTWTVDQPYPNQQITLSGGTGPYSQYHVNSGSLPNGLSVDPITGLISGTPTQTGTFTVVLEAQDSLGAVATKPYTFTINALPVISSPTSLPDWTVNQAYPNTQVNLTGGTPGYSNYTVASGSLPAGVSINPTTGLISGTPTNTGTYNVTIQAQDSTGAIASKPYTLTVNAAPQITAPTTLPNWTVNQAYPNEQVTLAGGTPGYSNYQISTGNLPAGLTLNPTTGLISGTPTATGTFSLTVQAQDSTGALASKPYTFTVNAAPSIAGPQSLPDWTVGQPYPPQTIAPKDGTPGYTFGIVGGALPPGMTLDPLTGVISGTPTTSGPVTIQVEVTDSTGAKSIKPYSFFVNSAPVIVSPTSLPNWTVNQAYPNQTVQMNGGTPGYSDFVIATGSLPAGMSLNPISGVISGTPTNTGTYTLQIQGQDSTGAKATYPYSFVVNAAPTISGPASLPNWTAGQPYPTEQVTLANGTPGYSNYQLASGTLPVGVTLDPNTGVISGTPTAPGNYSLLVQAQDSTGALASKPYSFTINAAPSIAGPQSLPDWTVGQPYPPQTIVPQAGTPGYTFGIVGGALPPGMTLDPLTGIISGTPTVSGPVSIQVEVTDSTGATSIKPYSFFVNGAPLIVSPTSLPNWTVGQAYPTQTVTMNGGTPGYSNFAIATGSLPAGMSLNPISGVISGTPGNTGTYTLQIQGQDSTGAKATYPYSFVVNAAPTISGPASLPNWTAGQPYPTEQVTLANGTPGYSNYQLASGTLPAGVTLDPNTGVISGTPTAPGNYSLLVQAQDSTGALASKPYNFTINAAVGVAGPQSLPNWTVGQPYPPQTIIPQAGTPGYTFALVGGSLPPGMTLDPITGVISGTPTTSGPVNIQVQVTDSTGSKSTQPYSFFVNGAPVIVSPTSLPNWTVGQAYPNQTVQMASGTPGYSNFVVSTGSLPNGMVLNPVTGVISGTPLNTGTYTLQIQGQDSTGAKASYPYSFIVNALPTITGPASLPNWTIGQPYPAEQIALTGGTPGYSNYKLASGSLPAGLSIDPNSGLLTGTPAGTGSFNITVQAQDSAGAIATKPYSFTINVLPSVAGPNSLPNWTIGQPYPPQTIVPQGGTPGYSGFQIVGGTLPDGMTLDPVTGVISGTPKVPGPVNIVLGFVDSTGAKGTQPYSFVVNAKPEIIQPSSLQDWTVGQAYPNTQVVVANGTPGYSNYSIAAGSLPTGMIINPLTGLISGTPQQTGPFAVVVQATDSAGAIASKSYVFTVNVRPTIAGPSSLPNWTVNQPYPPQTITPQGGTPGYSGFKVVSGQLPDGMTLDPVTGVISGTPTVPGPVNIVVEAQDSTGAIMTTPYSFNINPWSPEAALVITSDSGGKATVGEPYRGQASVPVGGTGPFTYAITSGSLPAGVTLDPKTGLISGTPTGGQAGDYPFTITVTDAAGAKSSANSVISLGYFSLSGTVYYDINHNKVLDTADYGIVNVLMTLTGNTAAGLPVTMTTTTNADGYYDFANLYPGHYTVTRADLKGIFRPEVVNPGLLGGIPTNKNLSLACIEMNGAAVDDVMNNFGNLQMPTCKLRKLALSVGNQYQDVLNRRAANPERFDANHPAMVPALDAGEIPWGVKPFPAAPKYALSYIPKLGTKAFAYGQPVVASVKPALRQLKAASSKTASKDTTKA